MSHVNLNGIEQWGLADSLNRIRDICHSASVEGGWWENKLAEYGVPDEVWRELQAPVKIALVHSELSEQLEGVRRNASDDKLPHRKMEEVEAADAIIRILDYCGARGLDVGGALVEKMIFNASRADHKPEARSAENGKRF